MSAQHITCCGCGAPWELGEYKTCDCPTDCGRDRSADNQPTLVAKPRCTWCNAVPTAHNLDGDDLCRSCCNKWVRSEGLADELAPDAIGTSSCPICGVSTPHSHPAAIAKATGAGQ